MLFILKSTKKMPKIKIIVSYNKLRDDDLDTKSQVIINKMTDNKNFPEPSPKLEEVAKVRAAYVSALTAKQSGDKETTALKNETRTALEEQLSALAMYVQLNCKNNEVIALSSGFDLQKPRAPIGQLLAPTDFKVTNGAAPGTFVLNAKKVVGAKSYIFEYTAIPVTDASVWVAQSGSSKTITLEGLTSGQQYAFRMAAIGTDPSILYSDILMRFTL